MEAGRNMWMEKRNGMLLVLLAVVMIIMSNEAMGVDFSVVVMVPLTGSNAPSAIVASQWTELVQNAADNITNTWNNGNRLLVNISNTQSARYRELQIVAWLSSEPSVVGVIAIGVPDAELFNIALNLKLHDVRPSFPTPIQAPTLSLCFTFRPTKTTLSHTTHFCHTPNPPPSLALSPPRSLSSLQALSNWRIILNTYPSETFSAPPRVTSEPMTPSPASSNFTLGTVPPSFTTTTPSTVRFLSLLRPLHPSSPQFPFLLSVD